GFVLIFAVVTFASCLDSFTTLKIARTKKDLEFIGRQLTKFKAAHREYPPAKSAADLGAQLSLKLLPQDAWGTPYRYIRSPDGQRCLLISAGPDRIFAQAWSRSVQVSSQAAYEDDLALEDGHTIVTGPRVR